VFFVTHSEGAQASLDYTSGLLCKTVSLWVERHRHLQLRPPVFVQRLVDVRGQFNVSVTADRLKDPIKSTGDINGNLSNLLRSWVFL
jgi:hypothetical protein